MTGDLLAKLRDLQRRLEALDGQHSVPFSEIFNDEFMLAHTDFESIAAMLEASGFTVESSDDFAAIPDEPWDAFVRERTRFDSWDEMRTLAGKEWVQRQLGFDS